MIPIVNKGEEIEIKFCKGESMGAHCIYPAKSCAKDCEIIKRPKVEEKKLFEWVKASDTPDEYDTYTTMIEQRGGGKVSQKPAFSQWNGQWRTEEGWTVIEWARSLLQSSLKEEKPDINKINANSTAQEMADVVTSTLINSIQVQLDEQSSLTPKSIRDSDGWISVEERFPDSNDTCEDYYNEVLTLQLGSKRPAMIKYWEVKNSPFVKFWMPLPAPPNEKAKSWTDKQDTLDKAKSASLKPNK